MSEEKKGFFARLKEGLTKTRDNIVRGIDSVFSGFSAIDDDFYEELEEILIMGDIGVNATTAIVERLKQQVKEKHIKEPSECPQVPAKPVVPALPAWSPPSCHRIPLECPEESG